MTTLHKTWTREFQSMKSVGYDQLAWTCLLLDLSSSSSLSLHRAMFAHSTRVFHMTFSFQDETVMHSWYISSCLLMIHKYKTTGEKWRKSNKINNSKKKHRQPNRHVLAIVSIISHLALQIFALCRANLDGYSNW